MSFAQVLYIRAKKRTGPTVNWLTSVRKILRGKYGDEPVALGGLFAVNQGRVRVHAEVR